RQVTQAVDVLDGAGIVAVRDLLNELAELAVAAVVEPLMCGLDIRPRRDLRSDDAADAHLDGAPCVAIERIGHGEAYLVVAQIERQYAGLAQEFRADFRLEDGAIGEIGRADDRKTKLAGGRLGN